MLWHLPQSSVILWSCAFSYSSSSGNAAITAFTTSFRILNSFTASNSEGSVSSVFFCAWDTRIQAWKAGFVDGIAQETVEPMMSSRLLPLEYEAVFMIPVVRPAMKVLVEYPASQPVVKPAANIARGFLLEFVEIPLGVNPAIVRRLEESNATTAGAWNTFDRGHRIRHARRRNPPLEFYL